MLSAPIFSFIIQKSICFISKIVFKIHILHQALIANLKDIKFKNFFSYSISKVQIPFILNNLLKQQVPLRLSRHGFDFVPAPPLSPIA